MKDYIGKYVKQFESGNLGSMALSSCGNDWGLSCGSYQLTLRWGNCIRFLKRFFPEEAKTLYFNNLHDVVSKSWPGADYCSSPQDVKVIWTICFNKVKSDKFFEYEHLYIKENFYDQICYKLSSQIDILNSNRAFQECFWSWSVARGVNGCYKEFQEVIKNIDLNTIPSETLFDLIYDYRYQKQTYNRYKKGYANGEREILRALLPKIQQKEVKEMKYSNGAIPLRCMMTNSTCYKETKPMTIKGVLWHSTGANNPTLKRYVQPSDDDPNYDKLMSIIGKNIYGNDINHIVRYGGGLNAWIGQLADGTVTTLQTMPWNYRPWGCGSGENGSCNNGWIQFECCEDGLQDSTYFNKVYEEACQLTAYLCGLYNIDPYGTVKVGNIQVPTILCHADAAKLGMANAHGDVLHWFPKHGKSMDDVRADVAKLMENTIIELPKEEEEEEMTQEKFNEFMNNYLLDLASQPANEWSKDALKWAQDTGLMKGDYQGNLMPKKTLTREEFIVVMQRFYDEFVR